MLIVVKNVMSVILVMLNSKGPCVHALYMQELLSKHSWQNPWISCCSVLWYLQWQNSWTTSSLQENSWPHQDEEPSLQILGSIHQTVLLLEALYDIRYLLSLALAIWCFQYNDLWYWEEERLPIDWNASTIIASYVPLGIDFMNATLAC